MFAALTFTPEQKAAMDKALAAALRHRPHSYTALIRVADEAISRPGSGVTDRYTDRWLQRQRKAGCIRTEWCAGHRQWVITDEGRIRFAADREGVPA